MISDGQRSAQGKKQYVSTIIWEKK